MERFKVLNKLRNGSERGMFRALWVLESQRLWCFVATKINRHKGHNAINLDESLIKKNKKQLSELKL